MAISKSDVCRFPAGTAEYVVMHALRSASRGRKPSATLPWIRNPNKALKEAKRLAYFPNSRSYLEGKVPENYVCGKCGATGVKLWRDYQTFLEHQSLRCLSCACSEESKVRVPTEDGRSLYAEERHMYRTATMEPYCWKEYNPAEGLPKNAVETKIWRDRTDQIGWRVPAVPTEENDTYWGYTSVPQPGCDWWYNLPFSITHSQ
jgi:hypothetical protein